MRVQVDGEVPVQERDESAQRWAADEPLKVRAARVMVRTVEPGAGDDLEQALKEVLMAGVHPNGDGRLPPVATEAALTDEYAEEESDLQLGWFVRLGQVVGSSTWGCCYTVWYHVKRRGLVRVFT